MGRYILQALVDSDYNVTVMSRADSTSKFEGIPESSVVRGEYTPEFFRKVLTGKDALVLAVGSMALDSQKEMIDAAAEVGVKRILPSEFGGVRVEYHPSNKAFEYDSLLTRNRTWTTRTPSMRFRSIVRRKRLRSIWHLWSSLTPRRLSRRLYPDRFLTGYVTKCTAVIHD